MSYKMVKGTIESMRNDQQQQMGMQDSFGNLDPRSVRDNPSDVSGSRLFTQSLASSFNEKRYYVMKLRSERSMIQREMKEEKQC
jgi:hypothetical protein